MERTKQINKSFKDKNLVEITRLYTKTDIILLADVFENFIKVSTENYGCFPLNCVSICSYSSQCCLKYTDIKLQTSQDKDMKMLCGITLEVD